MKVIVVVGFGPGNSTAIAEKFGSAGFVVAIVGRNAERLAAGVAALKARGITAAAFTGNAAEPDSIRATIRRIRTELGPITVLHWNASGGADVGDLLAVDPSEARGIFDVAVVGLLAAVREALPDLKNAGDGALLITNGGFAMPRRRRTRSSRAFMRSASVSRMRQRTSSPACSLSA
jgi:NAD(P)-dependent dehydrogenase (short-subunit alcohol dehydrogenase family)